MSTGKLSYFGLHGRAGGIRMMLKHGNVAFENNMIAQEDWPALKSTMPGGSMPIWQPTGSEMKLSQSQAIFHHLGQKHGYCADSAQGVFRQEFALECWNDFANGGSWFTGASPELTDEQKEKFLVDAVKLVERVATLFDVDDSKYISGAKITIADFCIFSYLSTICDNEAAIHAFQTECLKEAISKAPKMQAWYTNMMSENAGYLAARQPAPL